MALKILLIDPDTSWLSQTKKFLIEKGYDVDVADNGKGAQLAIYNAVDSKIPYFYVVLNIETQNHPGPMVMKYIKSRFPTTNVCITLDDMRLVEDGDVTEEKAQRIGAQEFLPKPFDMEKLLSTIEGKQTLTQLVKNMKKNKGLSEEEEVDLGDSEFSKIPVDEFYPNKVVLFDVFVKIRKGRYMKILHAGDTFSKDRIEKYSEEKNVKEFFIKALDRKKYIRHCNHLANKLITKDLANSTSVKVGLLKSTAEKFLEEVHTEGLKPNVVEQGKEVVNTVYNMIDSSEDLYKLLRDFSQFDPNSVAHSYLVCLFASMIVKEFEWSTQSTLETVAMASLFHDIGKIKLPPAIAVKKQSEMSPEEFEVYKQHPEFGAELVDGNPMVTQSMKHIIMQHHENSDGTGFPDGLKDPKLLTMSKILRVADYFANYVCEHDVTPTEALKAVLIDRENVKKFNGHVLEKFMMAFVDPSKKKTDSKLQSNSKVVNSSKKVS